jgi:hypothetical protein
VHILHFQLTVNSCLFVEYYHNYSTNFSTVKKHPFLVNFIKVMKNKIVTEAFKKIHTKNVVQNNLPFLNIIAYILYKYLVNNYKIEYFKYMYFIFPTYLETFNVMSTGDTHKHVTLLSLTHSFFPTRGNNYHSLTLFSHARKQLSLAHSFFPREETIICFVWKK